MEAREARASWQAWHDRVYHYPDRMKLVQAQFDEECRRRAEEFRKRADEKEEARRLEEELQQIKVTHARPV